MITAIPEITNTTSYLCSWLQKPTSSNLWTTCLYLFMFLIPFMQVKIHESRTHRTDCLSVMWEKREYSRRKMLINLARSSLLFVSWHLIYFYHRDTTDVLQKASSIFWRTWNSEGIGEKHSKWPAGLKDNRNICHSSKPRANKSVMQSHSLAVRSRYGTHLQKNRISSKLKFMYFPKFKPSSMKLFQACPLSTGRESVTKDS